MLNRRRRQAFLGAGGGITHVRYIKMEKQDAAVGGHYTYELKFFYKGVEVSIASAKLSSSGLDSFNAAALVDNNNLSIAFWTDSSGPGSHFTYDDGAGNGIIIDEIRVYVGPGVKADWGLLIGNDSGNLQRMTITETDPVSALDNNALDVNIATYDWVSLKFDPAEYTGV